MVQSLRVNKTSAVQQAVDSLRSYIQARAQAGDTRLASETELTKSLGISHLTLREALVLLERDGLITRAHGKSTLINGFIRHLPCRIDTERDIDTFLEAQGYSTHSKVLKYEWRAAAKDEASKLEIDEGAPLLVVEKVFMADDMPVALYVDRVPRALFGREDFTVEDFANSMFTLVEEACQCHITHDVLEIAPVLADKRISELFVVPRRAPLLRADVLEYSEDGKAVMYNTEFYHDKFIRFTLCRTIHFSS
jgi:GntR family transcriptional regulator